MTQAVCFKCGEIKLGSFTECKKCGAQPRSDNDLMLSVALSDHYFDLGKLEEVGHQIKHGIVPELSEQTRSKLLPELQAAKKKLIDERRSKRSTMNPINWKREYQVALALSAAVGIPIGTVIGFMVHAMGYGADSDSWGYWISHPINRGVFWWMLTGAIICASISYIRMLMR